MNQIKIKQLPYTYFVIGSAEAQLILKRSNFLDASPRAQPGEGLRGLKPYKRQNIG